MRYLTGVILKINDKTQKFSDIFHRLSQTNASRRRRKPHLGGLGAYPPGKFFKTRCESVQSGAF